MIHLASFVQSFMACERSDKEGVRNKTFPPTPTIRSANMERRECLTGPAGHDQLASIMLLETSNYIVERFLLDIP